MKRDPDSIVTGPVSPPPFLPSSLNPVKCVCRFAGLIQLWLRRKGSGAVKPETWLQFQQSGGRCVPAHPGVFSVLSRYKPSGDRWDWAGPLRAPQNESPRLV